MSKIDRLIEYYNGDMLASNVLSDKYLMKEEVLPNDMWKRLADNIANVEEESKKDEWAEKFYNLLNDWKFIAGGRINYAIGRKENVSATNCYVIPIRDTIDYENIPSDYIPILRAYLKFDGDLEKVKSYLDDTDYFINLYGGSSPEEIEKLEKEEALQEIVDKYLIKADSLEGIYNWLKESALTYRSTGGVGTDISVLRPKGTPVKNSGGESPGSCSFMDLFSQSTNTVHQKLRRGALMITINVHHPDVMDFINIKKILGKIDFVEGEGNGYNNLYKLVEHANISVQLTDEFLKALENDEKYEQRWPIDAENPEIKRKISAKKIWDSIIKNAHEHAEPGIFFSDNHKRNDALWYKNPAITTNPCGEQFLGGYSNCLLGHMNLAKYINNNNFDFENFGQDIKIAVRFLDNVITYNDGKHALPQQNEIAKNERRIGLGITGLADALIRLGIQYDSEIALEFVQEVMIKFRDSAYEGSVNIAKEKGAFNWFEKDKWLKSEFTQRWYEEQIDEIQDNFNKYGIRNSFLSTVAPVGSGSIIAQVSSGIEPIFATSYSRRVRQQDGETFKTYKTYPKIISELFGDDENLPNYVVTAHDIKPDFRVKIQAVIQNYIDNSISSTINLSNDTPVETVAQIYLDSWKNGLKSMTVYRDGSREGVLILDEEEKKEEKKEPEKEVPKKRAIALGGKTYKIPDGADRKLYITINGFEDNPTRPFEVFIHGYGPDDAEIKSIAVLTSALLRKSDNIDFIIDHLGKIDSPKHGVFWHDKDASRRHYINSVPKALSIALKKYIDEMTALEKLIEESESSEKLEGTNGITEDDKLKHAGQCPKCNDLTYIQEEGCKKCISCGFSKCG